MDKYTSNNQTYMINGRTYTCPFELTTSIIMSKWKLKIVNVLYKKGKLRYSDLKRNIMDKITHKMLIQSVRELESDGIILRFAYPEVPPRVEYSLTDNGMKLREVIEAMNKFGRDYKINSGNKKIAKPKSQFQQKSM